MGYNGAWLGYDNDVLGGVEDKKSSHSTAHSNVDYQDKNCVKVPKIYWNLTRKAVLTMEWIDGIKLTDEAGISKACLNRKELIDQGLYCSLRQLLEVGFFHADPHPGNLVATKDGSLAYFDFGMMGEIPRHFRVGLIQVGRNRAQTNNTMVSAMKACVSRITSSGLIEDMMTEIK
ncbi:hypothetical protein RJ640_019331 [Escallonia rubra]|uniref:ABC1 atypical kinase-like domain-containing protein n=1 Tax=Escallonia rubra TaxID=112253 RepID=A0AA88QDD2_9ASTE|nr:hypothetical protein RJ640_019331 [Escallonia rubra]